MPTVSRDLLTYLLTHSLTHQPACSLFAYLMRQAIAHGRVDRAVWSAELSVLEEAAAEAASQAATPTPYPLIP